MACYHPLNAYRTSTIVDGKRKIVFAPDKNLSDEYLKSIGAEKLAIPCGQCVGCRLEYSRQWAMRCFFEAKKYKYNYFVTLTYNDEHLPIVPHAKVDPDTGEVISIEDVATLDPVELQKFIKRLRRYAKREFGADNIRFFACGEYGSLNMRPHYHLILFNVNLPDLKLEKVENGFSYYRSPFIEKCWKRGFCIVSDFSFSTAAYVARYMLKKHKGLDRDYYSDRGLYPEFTRCSRRPGIGWDYYDSNKDAIYRYDEVFIPRPDEAPLQLKPPKYYDRLFELENPALLEYNKGVRKNTAINSMDLQLLETDLSEQEYLATKEQSKLLSIRKLKRSV